MNASTHLFWSRTDPEGDLVPLWAMPSQELDQLPHAKTIDDLMLGLYESEDVWHLARTDAYALVDTETNPVTVALFDYTQELFKYAVDASWAAQVKRCGYFVWVLIHDTSLEHLSSLNFDQLVEARDDEKLELISIAIGPAEDNPEDE